VAVCAGYAAHEPVTWGSGGGQWKGAGEVGSDVDEGAKIYTGRAEAAAGEDQEEAGR